MTDPAETLRSLRAAVAPFARLAAGIPPNWPGRCVLTIDESRSGHHLNYLAEREGAYYPTIDDWRRLAGAYEASRSPEITP